MSGKRGTARFGRVLKSGFILPLTLVVVSVVSLSLWSAAIVLDGLRQDLRTLRQRTALETSAATMEARLAYLLATEPLGPRGLRIGEARIIRGADTGFEDLPQAGETGAVAPFWFDNRAYAASLGSEHVSIQVQDLAGLFNLNSQDPGAPAQFLRALDVDERDAARLGDALEDFTDPDDLRRLNGAESDDYRRLDLPAPLNEQMREPAQVWRALGWRALGAQAKEGVRNFAAVVPLNAPSNINTASAATLRGWFGLDQQEAAFVLEARQNRFFLGLSEVSEALGRPLIGDEMRLYSFPHRAMRVWVREDGQAHHLIYETIISFAPSTADRPFFWSNVVVRTNLTAVGGAVESGQRERFPDIPGVLPSGAGPVRAERTPD